MKEYAEENNVPIITDEGIDYIRDYIKENKDNLQKVIYMYCHNKIFLPCKVENRVNQMVLRNY